MLKAMSLPLREEGSRRLLLLRRVRLARFYNHSRLLIAVDGDGIVPCMFHTCVSAPRTVDDSLSTLLAGMRTS